MSCQSGGALEQPEACHSKIEYAGLTQAELKAEHLLIGTARQRLPLLADALSMSHSACPAATCPRTGPQLSPANQHILPLSHGRA